MRCVPWCIKWKRSIQVEGVITAILGQGRARRQDIREQRTSHTAISWILPHEFRSPEIKPVGWWNIVHAWSVWKWLLVTPIQHTSERMAGPGTKSVHEQSAFNRYCSNQSEYFQHGWLQPWKPSRTLVQILSRGSPSFGRNGRACWFLWS